MCGQTSTATAFPASVDLAAGRNHFVAPPFVNLDARLSKRFRLGDRLRLEPLIEVFNVFNRANPGEVQTAANAPVPFGTVTQVHATTEVPTGVCPTAVAVNPVTNKIYVANRGSRVFFCISCSNLGSVTIIDGKTNAAITIADPNARFPQAVAVNPATNKIYVANEGSSNVTVIDGVNNSIRTVRSR